MASILLLQALEHEWAVVVSSRWSRRQLHSWAGSDPTFVGYRSLDEVLSEIRHGDQDRSRELCWSLLARVDSDDLARRAVLQAMMPALTNELMRVLLPARNDPSTSFDPDDNEVEQILVTAASEAIMSHAGSASLWPMSDLVRRTHRLVIRALKSERRWRDHNTVGASDDVDDSLPHPAAPAEPVMHPMVELINVVDAIREMNRITDGERDLIIATRCVGYGLGDLVDVLGASADTLKHRRARAEKKVISGSAELAELLEAS